MPALSVSAYVTRTWNSWNFALRAAAFSGASAFGSGAFAGGGGVPVVQPDHGAFPELIAASGGGVICPPDDVKALADALETLLQDDHQREQITNRGLAGVRNEFSAARMAERFDAVLASVKEA